jgi:hypothetical protein
MGGGGKIRELGRITELVGGEGRGKSMNELGQDYP